MRTEDTDILMRLERPVFGIQEPTYSCLLPNQLVFELLDIAHDKHGCKGLRCCEDD
jgi:hypothetical protein